MLAIILDEIPHIGDILAIVLIFPIFIYYFATKKEPTLLENYLLIMAILGLIADISFTIIHYITRNKKIEF